MDKIKGKKGSVMAEIESDADRDGGDERKVWLCKSHLSIYHDATSLPMASSFEVGIGSIG